MPNKPYGLKKNSKAVLDIIAGQQAKNHAQAYKMIYPKASDNTARSNAYQLLQKTSAQIYLQQHINKASETVVDLLNSEKDDIRLRSAQDILDRTHGKAKQITEVTSTGVTLNIDLTTNLQPEQIEHVAQ
jgi:hypothetical protein